MCWVLLCCPPWSDSHKQYTWVKHLLFWFVGLKLVSKMWQCVHIQKIYRRFIWAHWELSRKGEIVGKHSWIVGKHSWIVIITQEFVFLLKERKPRRLQGLRTLPTHFARRWHGILFSLLNRNSQDTTHPRNQFWNREIKKGLDRTRIRH